MTTRDKQPVAVVNTWRFWYNFLLLFVLILTYPYEHYCFTSTIPIHYRYLLQPSSQVFCWRIGYDVTVWNRDLLANWSCNGAFNTPSILQWLGCIFEVCDRWIESWQNLLKCKYCNCLSMYKDNFTILYHSTLAKSSSHEAFNWSWPQHLKETVVLSDCHWLWRCFCLPFIPTWPFVTFNWRLWDPWTWPLLEVLFCFVLMKRSWIVVPYGTFTERYRSGIVNSLKDSTCGCLKTTDPFLLVSN